jgi:hypothetical protein
MNVKQLRQILAGIDDDAKVTLAVSNRTPGSSDGVATGAPIYFAVTNVDDCDKFVVISNFVADQRGNDVFDAPAQFKRFKVSTADGVAAAAADLIEQYGCEATEDMDEHLRKQALRDVFDDFKYLIEKLNDT